MRWIRLQVPVIWSLWSPAMEDKDMFSRVVILRSLWSLYDYTFIHYEWGRYVSKCQSHLVSVITQYGRDGYVCKQERQSTPIFVITYYIHSPIMEKADMFTSMAILCFWPATPYLSATFTVTVDDCIVNNGLEHNNSWFDKMIHTQHTSN